MGLHVKYPLVLSDFNSLNPELNPICYLLALLGAHHLLHVSRIRVNAVSFQDALFLSFSSFSLTQSVSRTLHSSPFQASP